jgi:Ase1/PRC1/MAP65 family protein
MIDEAQALIKTIKQMEMSLEDEKNSQYGQPDEDLQITFPLNRCLVFLKEKYTAIGKLHRERFEQVKSKFP